MKTLLALLWALGMWSVSTAQAATYNFYFNNAEQGANSTAAPSIKVGESYSAKDADAEVTTPVAPEPQPTETPAPAEAVAQSGCSSNLLCQIGMAMPHGIKVGL